MEIPKCISKLSHSNRKASLHRQPPQPPTNHPVIVREQYKTLHPPTAFLITLYPNTDQISFPPAQNIDLTFPCPRRPTLSFNQRPQIAIPAQSHLSRPHQFTPFLHPFSNSTQLSILKPFIRASTQSIVLSTTISKPIQVSSSRLTQHPLFPSFQTPTAVLLIRLRGTEHPTYQASK